MNYKASMGISVQIITIGTFALFGFLGYNSVMELIYDHGNLTQILLHSCLLIFLVGTILISFLFSPTLLH